MSGCCEIPGGSEPAEKFFSRKSKRYAKRFRKRGLERTQEYLLEGVRKELLASREILDIGCGIGSLHLTLLEEGASSATGVDVSVGMIDQAKKIASDRHLDERTRYVVGDFVHESTTIGDADVTLLDKVVCCYEDYPSLINASTSKTRQIYALSHPRKNFIIASVFKTQIFISKLFRSAFQPFWHDWQRVHELILDEGFQLIYSNSTFVWQVLVFKRVR